MDAESGKVLAAATSPDRELETTYTLHSRNSMF